MLPTKNDKGEYPAFAWPGGYPLFYWTADDKFLCPDCANGKNCSEEIVVGGEVHWEGEPLTCDRCNAEIESAYGPVESEAEDEA